MVKNEPMLVAQFHQIPLRDLMTLAFQAGVVTFGSIGASVYVAASNPSASAALPAVVYFAVLFLSIGLCRIYNTQTR